MNVPYRILSATKSTDAFPSKDYQVCLCAAFENLLSSNDTTTNQPLTYASTFEHSYVH